MRRSLFFLFFVSFSLLLPAAAKRAADGFKLGKTALIFPHRPEWEVAMDPSIHSILNQPFYYFSKGAQCYVFESADRQFVLKLFRYDQPPSFQKVESLFNASKLAYDHLKEETALIYIHLNRTDGQLPVVRCSDRLGRVVSIALDQARFAIQKKGEDFVSAFERGVLNPDRMKELIDQFVDLLIRRAQKGILNGDRSLWPNFGFVEGKAVEFDFGQFREIPGLGVADEVRPYTSQLEEWLIKNSPEGCSYLTHRLDNLK